MAIMAYAPFEVFPDREMGDESDIVYRSNDLFAAIIYKKQNLVEGSGLRQHSNLQQEGGTADRRLQFGVCTPD